MLVVQPPLMNWSVLRLFDDMAASRMQGLPIEFPTMVD